MKKWDSGFMSKSQAQDLFIGPSNIKMVPFHELSYGAQRDAVRSYVNKGGGKYEFVDEHYYYPVEDNGSLYHGRSAHRVLAIPNRLIGDEKYMASLGYEIAPAWQNRHVAQELLMVAKTLLAAYPNTPPTEEDRKKWREQGEDRRRKDGIRPRKFKP